MTLFRTWTGHTESVNRLSMNGDGSLLAAGDHSGNVILWRVKDGEDLGRVPGRGTQAYVSHLALTRTGDLLVMAFSFDPKIYLWAPAGVEIRRWDTKGADVSHLHLSRSGTLLAAHSGYSVELWSLPDGRLIHEFDSRGGSATVAITPDERYVVVGDNCGIRMWALPECAEPISLDEHGPDAYTGGFVLGGGGSLLAGDTVLGEKNSIRVWSLPKREVLADARGHWYPKGIIHGGKVLLASARLEDGAAGFSLIDFRNE